MRNDNFYVVQGFMINELKLKGNELSVFAIIYGFSQEPNQWFSGNLQYLADWTGATKQGIIKNLKSLIDKNLIKKREKLVNNIKVVEYRECLTEFNGIKLSLTGGIKLSLPNNINNNNIEERILKKEKFVPPTLEELTEYAKSQGRGDLARAFYDYYTTDKDHMWIDSKGQPVRSWKQKFLTWCKQDDMGIKLQKSFGDNDPSIIHSRKYSKKDMDNIVNDIDEIEI